MGASTWRYYTPYVSDPESALQTLRAEVFATGDYLDPTGSLETTLRHKFHRFGMDVDDPENRAIIANAEQVNQAVHSGNTSGLNRSDSALVKQIQMAQQWAALLGATVPSPTSGPPSSIDDLLERAAESGTHSILDIEHTARRRGFSLATPIPQTTLRRFFGTVEPTHDAAEQHWADVAELLSSWQAYHFIVFSNGKPDEYAFVGCSGD